MTRGSIRVCREPREAHWQLGPLPPPTGRLTLIGWHSPSDESQGGIPREIVRILARALTSVCRITYATSTIGPDVTSSWRLERGDSVRSFSPKGVAGRLLARLHGMPPVFGLRSTTAWEAAASLFDDAGFPWWLQGQVVVLSSLAGPPPDADEGTWLALFDDDWIEKANSLCDACLDGILRPGVDGDVAGLLTWSAKTEAAVLAAIAREAQQGGLDCIEVSETDVAGPLHDFQHYR